MHDGAPSLTSSAAQALSPDGRYAVVFAGNGFTRKTNFFRLKSTFVFDLCEPRRVCRATESSLRYRKWALTGCTTLSGKEFIICGGDSPDEDDPSKDRQGNTDTCDIFDLDNLVEECHSARPGRGKGWKYLMRTTAKEDLRIALEHDMKYFVPGENRTRVMADLDVEILDKDS